MDSPVLGSIEWRELWGEQLTPEARRRIGRAVGRGSLLLHPDEAAIAAELAIRRLRSLRLGIVISLVIALSMVFALLAGKPVRPSASYWFFLCQWSLAGTAIALLGPWKWRNLTKAYLLNRRVSEDGRVPPAAST